MNGSTLIKSLAATIVVMVLGGPAVQRASKEVCGGGSLRHGGSIIMKSSGVRCYWKTLSNAVDKIDNEDLSRIHAG